MGQKFMITTDEKTDNYVLKQIGEEYRDKIVCIPIDFGIELFTRDTAIPETVEYLVNEVQKKQDYLIVIPYHSEGLGVRFLGIVDKIVKDLILKHDIDYNKILFTCSAAYVEFNKKNYYVYCAKYGHMPLRVAYTNHWESQGSCFANQFPEINFNSNANSEKKFLFFNRHPHPHRLFLIGELMKRNLLEQSYYSLSSPPEDIQEGIDIIPGQNDLMKNYVSQLKDRLPITLGTDLWTVDSEIQQFYNNSLFSVVTETTFLNSCDVTVYGELFHCYPGPFYTEKTWKAVRAKHPFIIATSPFAMQSLKELGYQTFHPYINESYDSIQDDASRLYAIADEIERLCNMSESETTEWLQNVQPICEHNFQVLKNKGIVTKYSWE
jgi:hypothetical protein